MKTLKGIVIAILSMVLLFYAARINTSASAQAPRWENAPEDNGDFIFWNGTEAVHADMTHRQKVEWMQNALNWCIENEGLEADALEVDGKFGPASHCATVAFQEAAGLEQDGYFGADTIIKMKEILYDGQKNSLALNRETNSRKDTEQIGQRWNVTYGSSEKDITAACCDCTADQKCGDCAMVYLFSSVNDLREAIRKSPAINTAKKAVVGMLEGALG